MRVRRTQLTAESELLPVLERARAVGFLGPGPLRVHVDHALLFARALPAGPARLLDMGSGAGLPGLPVLMARSDLSGVLLDASAKRGAFLTWAIAELGLADRVNVVTQRAEHAAHAKEWRHAFEAVLCRGFGPPAETVECAHGFLRPGGRLVISEPPERRGWPEQRLAALGLRVVTTHEGVVAFDRLEHGGSEDEELLRRLPRPIKQQRQRPLFSLTEPE